ncbi:MAG TPA: 16S rRNA (guanine(966)-N(2))-methyltransferase RsmD [Bryobacteraceae bacterium]|nr:16S rRNA (guanine(966)-N(2))-methyltransferase RsmD [Bryobacteraceae bacterium]
MRVIAGEFRSRKLKSLPGLDTRPTPDRLRETLFSILMPRLEGQTFVDAYAGTGAVGIEALSRGARRCIFIERNRSAVEIIRENLRSLGITNRAEVLQGRVLQYLPHRSAGIVFLDPPYASSAEYAQALKLLADSSPGLIVVQHDTRFALPEVEGKLVRTRLVKQGDNSLSFFELQHENTVEEPSSPSE